MSDHSSLHTGFGIVMCNIANALYQTDLYDLYEFAWFAPEKREIPEDSLPKWTVYITNRHDPDLLEADKYGQQSLEKVIASLRPNLLLTVGDEWMVRHVPDLKQKYGFTWIGYTPIDGLPHPPEWTKTFMSMDYCVAYGRFGVHTMAQRSRELKPLFLPHGVKNEVYYEDRTAGQTMREDMQVKESDFLIGFVGRNQPRKQIPLLLKAFSLWSKEHCVCTKTQRPFIVGSDRYINQFCYSTSKMHYNDQAKESALSKDRAECLSPWTGEGNNFYQSTRPELKLYLHCALDDVGWNLHEQRSRYKLDKSLILQQNLKIGIGFEEKEMRAMYNTMDIFCLPSIGEGFGLPVLEAMACGISLCVTDYSGHIDFAAGCGEFIQPEMYYTEPLSNIERALCDVAHMVFLFDKLYMEMDPFMDKWNPVIFDPTVVYESKDFGEALRKRYSHNGKFVARRMDWKNDICPQWVELVGHAIAKATTLPVEREKLGGFIDVEEI